MIRNVEFPEVKDVAVAVVPEINELNQTEWFIHVVNLGKTGISNLMVTSKGFGIVNKETVKTTTLRRSLGDVSAESSVKVESIPEELFKLNNEYWVSFYREGKLYDKKYLFTPGIIKEKHLKDLPVLNTKGIWHP
ncbi:MAG: hypothetical protein ACPGEG_09490 [Salibacteraceae bacterium]